MELRKWLKSPLSQKSLYFVIGPEAFFISEIKKHFLQEIFKDQTALDFNHAEFSAKENSIESLLSLLETLPFLTERRLVFCYESESLQAKDWERLSSFFSQDVENVILVCFFEKKDARKRHFKIFKDQALELSAETLRSWQMEPWLNFLFQREGLVFSSEAKSLFKDLMGSDLMEIQLELKKLKQYMGERKQIEERDILSCLSCLKKDNIFELTEAIGSKNIPRALKALASLLDQNQNEIGLITMIARHIRSLSRLQKGQKQKLNKSQLSQKTGISPYFLKTYLAQSHIWSEEQIYKAMEALSETDKALKSSPLSSHIWLENFILKVCS